MSKVVSLLVFLVLLTTSLSYGQQPGFGNATSIQNYPVSPTAPASGQCLTYNGTNIVWGSCAGSGGTGTVTNVSGLSPLFTVSTPTTTPTFALSPAAADTVFGNCTTGSTTPSYCSIVAAMLPTFGTSAAGIVPASGGGTTTFLRADGSWAVPIGGGSGTVNSGTTPDGAYYASSTTAVSDAGIVDVTFGALKTANAVVASTPLWYSVGALCGASCTGTTTFPVFFHQPTSTAAYTGWSNGANSGTVFGANEASGFTGNFMQAAIAGTQEFFIDASGQFNGLGIINIASANNSRFRTLSTGGQAYTNVAGNVALTVLNAQASPTADLLDIDFGATPTIAAKVTNSGVFSSAVGFAISGATTAGHYLRNNATDYVDSAIQSGDLTAALASPPAIGGTTPAAATFSSLTDTGLTLGFLPKAGTGGLLGNSHIDDGATTANTVTISENLVVNTGGSVNSTQIGTNVFSALPACGSIVEGTSAPVTDSTITTPGSTIIGGGSNHVLGYCNGTNWVIL